MNTPNETIVLLVTASNRAESLGKDEMTDLMRSAMGLIAELRATPGARSEPDVLPELEAGMAGVERASPEERQRLLRLAADAIRALQPAVEPEPGLPTHRPDGGDGGNY